MDDTGFFCCDLDRITDLPDRIRETILGSCCRGTIVFKTGSERACYERRSSFGIFNLGFFSIAYPWLLSALMLIDRRAKFCMAPCCRFGSARKPGSGRARLQQIFRDLEDKHVHSSTANGYLFVLEQPASSRFWLFGCWLYWLRKRHGLSQQSCCRQNLARASGCDRSRQTDARFDPRIRCRNRF